MRDEKRQSHLGRSDGVAASDRHQGRSDGCRQPRASIGGRGADEANAISQAAVPVILQTLRSVLSQGVEIQLKTLQTLVSLMTNCKGIHGAILSEVRVAPLKWSIT